MPAATGSPCSTTSHLGAAALRAPGWSWQARIEAALENDEFELHLQPSAAPRHRPGHQRRGADPAGRPRRPGVARRVHRRRGAAGLAPAVDSLGGAARHRPARPAARGRPGDAPVAVNLSAHSIGDPAIALTIEHALHEHGVDPHRLTVEVTETAAVADVDAARGSPSALRALGVEFSLDDFGAGYGSFYYLKHLSFDTIKIDGEFVKGAHDSAVDRAILRSVIGIARALGKRTVAEFVTDEGALSVVRELGVDYAQGYLIGEPVPFDQFVSTHLGGDHGIWIGPPPVEDDHHAAPGPSRRAEAEHLRWPSHAVRMAGAAESGRVQRQARPIRCFGAASAATVPRCPTFRIKEAADLLGVSDDTLRRWADARPGRDRRPTQRGGRSSRARCWRGSPRSSPHDATRPEPRPVVAESARNRFVGLVTRVIRDTVMAQVEIQAGPHRFVSLMSREAADELGLEPGVLAVAAVKSTNVVVEIPRPMTHRTASPTGRSPCAVGRAAPSPLGRRLGLAGCGSTAPARAPAAARPRRPPRRPVVTGTITVLRRRVAHRVVHDARQAVRGGPPGHQGDVQLRGRARPWPPQITQGAPADVFASASPRTWTRSSAAGAAADPTVFAKNVMEIAVPPANPAKVDRRRRPGEARRQGRAVPGRRCRAARRPQTGVRQRQDHGHAGHPGARREVGAEQGAARRGRRRRRLRDRRAGRRRQGQGHRDPGRRQRLDRPTRSPP